ncbi:unnamed protein product, partial [Brenthis ino]
MCIVVRLYDPETHKISSLLWELRPLFEKNDFDAANQGATGEAIYKSIIRSFQDENVPTENIIGFASAQFEHTFNDLNDPFMKLYFIFLQWVLPKFVNLNEYFQKSGVLITELDRKMRATYQELLLCYMERNYVVTNDINAIDPTKEEHFLRPESMYFGVQLMTEIANQDIQSRQDLISDFQKRARDFLITGCCQIRNRYDFSNVLLQKLSILSPKNAVSRAQRTMEPTLLPMMLKVPCIMKGKTNEQKQAIDDEWRLLPETVLPEDLFLDIDKMSPDEFWSKILHLSEPQFRNLAKFVLEVLSLPHANADSERIFSAVNLIKTKQRNRLLTSTINATLLAKQYISRKHSNCTTFKPTPEIITKIKKPSDYEKNATEDILLDDVVDLMGGESE